MILNQIGASLTRATHPGDDAHSVTHTVILTHHFHSHPHPHPYPNPNRHRRVVRVREQQVKFVLGSKEYEDGNLKEGSPLRTFIPPALLPADRDARETTRPPSPSRMKHEPTLSCLIRSRCERFFPEQRRGSVGFLHRKVSAQIYLASRDSNEASWCWRCHVVTPLCTPNEKQKIEDLRTFLARPRTSDETHPPTISPELSDLPGQVYLDLALDGRKRLKFEPTPDWQDKARACLTACVDRSSLVAIADLDQSAESPYNAERAQKHFVHMVVFKRRWELEEVVSEMLTLVELFRSETRNASSVPRTPTTLDDSRDRSLAEAVRDRDPKCRMTGISGRKKIYTVEDRQAALNGEAMYGFLEVAHGLPFGMGQASFDLLTALTGVQCKCTADCVENAIVLQSTIHSLFGSWKLYLEWTPDGQVMIRTRTDLASPIPELRSVVNVRRQICDRPGALIDQPLWRRHDENINDIDPKFFMLHKFIGDIVGYEEDDEDEMSSVTEDNIDLLMDKLNAPDMDLLPREHVWD
ncbi:hypothetical protein C8R44DRAFT_743176 [Mycena epipterygia]|nr:hypothetical protein C8R44DRAFT_743176 [Mycena epipterygia]